MPEKMRLVFEKRFNLTESIRQIPHGKTVAIVCRAVRTNPESIRATLNLVAREFPGEYSWTNRDFGTYYEVTRK